MTIALLICAVIFGMYVGTCLTVLAAVIIDSRLDRRDDFPVRIGDRYIPNNTTRIYQSHNQN